MVYTLDKTQKSCVTRDMEHIFCVMLPAHGDVLELAGLHSALHGVLLGVLLGALLGVHANATCSDRSATACAWSSRWHEMCVCFKHDIPLFY